MGEKREYRRRRRPPEDMELQQRQVDAGATQTAAQAQKCAGGAAVYRPASGGAGQKNVPQKGRAEETAAQKYSGSDFAAAASGSGVCRRENLGCGAAMGK